MVPLVSRARRVISVLLVPREIVEQRAQQEQMVRQASCVAHLALQARREILVIVVTRVTLVLLVRQAFWVTMACSELTVQTAPLGVRVTKVLKVPRAPQAIWALLDRRVTRETLGQMVQMVEMETKAKAVTRAPLVTSAIKVPKDLKVCRETPVLSELRAASV
jgi:hypothetical protein